MMATSRARTKSKTAPHPLDVPEFLRRKRGEKRAPAKAPPNSIDLSRPRPDEESAELNEGLAMYGMRVPASDEFGEGGFRIDEGVIPRRWARDSSAVMAVARHLAAKKEQYERRSAAREESVEKSKKERERRKAAMYRGMLKLDALLAEMGSAAPSVGRAKKAIERAHMIHRKFHFGPKEVEQARKVLRELPARSVGAGAGVGGTPSVRKTAPAPDGVVVLHVKSNPHKDGTEQHRRMALLMSFAGQSVAAYLAANGCRLKLKSALSRGWVILEKEAGAPAPAVKTTAPARDARGKDRPPATPPKAKAPPKRAPAKVKRKR